MTGPGTMTRLILSSRASTDLMSWMNFPALAKSPFDRVGYDFAACFHDNNENDSLIRGYEEIFNRVWRSRGISELLTFVGKLPIAKASSAAISALRSSRAATKKSAPLDTCRSPFPIRQDF